MFVIHFYPCFQTKMLCARSIKLKINPCNVSLSQAGLFHSSAILARRTGKRERVIPAHKLEKYKAGNPGPWWKKPSIVMTAPLAQTYHPPNQFKDLEESFLNEVAIKSESDLPVEMDDPYSKDPAMCVLCPRRYEENILPNYKNPKLLSQFVSPHTGHVYQSHITGLCSYMQGLVEREVGRSRSAGLMSTRVRDPHYLQDPSLFNPSRPLKPNPY